jgi:hypothetical protein
MGVGSSNPRNVERRIPKEIQGKSTSPVFGKGVYQKIHRFLGRGCPKRVRFLRHLSGPILAKYDLAKGSVPWNVLNVWPYEP